MRVLLTITLALAALLCAPQVWAGQATDLVKSRHKRLFHLAQQPRTPARRAALRAQLDAMFDKVAISRATIGKHWSSLTAAQQKELSKLQTRFWHRTYAHLLEHAVKHNFKIRYEGEQASSHGVWVLTEAHAIPTERWRIDFLVESGKVSDVRIESMSLVRAHRSQFKRVLRKSGYQGLVGKLRAKLAKPLAALPTPTPSRTPAPKQPASSSTGAMVAGAVALVALVAVLAWYDR